MQQSNMVNAIVRVGNSRVNFVSLRIEQTYGDHHYFELVLDNDVAGKSFMDDPKEQIRQIGRVVVIDLQHGNDNGSAYVFKGVITKVRMTGKDGKKGYVVLEGASPTIMMERGRRMDIYSNTTLRNLFKKLIDGVYTDYLKCLNEPTYANPIYFAMQYNETDWEFIKRIAYLYKENLFFSGSELLFGEYEEWKPIKLTYDQEISDIEFCSKMLPNQSINYQYLADQDTIIERESPKNIDNSNDYLDTASEQNGALTRDKPAKNIIGANISSKSELDELAKREKSRAAASTVYITGKSKTYESTIGRLITILMPENFSKTSSLGTYRVVKSIHYIDERLRYSNEFEAVPASLKTMPIDEPKMPIAESIIGKVRSNEDPKGLGRVQVDFTFANQYSKIWMRVMTPSAGLSDDGQKNRGMVFVPEKGDQVMIGFEYGDPNRPYVMGSMYHSNNGQGGQENNHLKSIITRNGHTIQFDDAEESLGIIIKDKNGNSIFLDTKGKNIEITAPETISMKAKNITMEAEENIMGQAKQNINMNADNNMEFVSGEDCQMTSNNMFVNVSEDTIHTSKKYELTADQARIDSTQENLELASGAEVDVQSAKKVKLF